MATRKKTKSRSRASSRTSSSPSRKKTSSRKKTRRKSSRRYGAKASKKVERSMHEMKRGTLRSGRSGKKVTSQKQAIAIGLSEARRAGGKVPRSPTGTGRRRGRRSSGSAARR